jgi:hypothetical protein
MVSRSRSRSPQLNVRSDDSSDCAVVAGPTRPEIDVKILTIGRKPSTLGANLLSDYPWMRRHRHDVRPDLHSDAFDMHGGPPGNLQPTLDRIAQTDGCQQLVYAVAGCILTDGETRVILQCNWGKHRSVSVGVLVESALSQGFHSGRSNAGRVDLRHLELGAFASTREAMQWFSSA